MAVRLLFVVNKEEQSRPWPLAMIYIKWDVNLALDGAA